MTTCACTTHYPGPDPICAHCGKPIIAGLKARAEAAEDALAASEAREALLAGTEDAELIALRAEVERLTRERDAADERLATAQEKWVERGYVAGQHAAEAEARRLLERAEEAARSADEMLACEIRAFLNPEPGK